MYGDTHITGIHISLSLRGRRKKGRGRGEGEREKGREPIPLPFFSLFPFLPIPYPLPLSTPATQATYHCDIRHPPAVLWLSVVSGFCLGAGPREKFFLAALPLYPG